MGNMYRSVHFFSYQYPKTPKFFIFLQILGSKIIHFGWLESKSEYTTILSEADVVVSTANHEFFGVAMLEAAASGCLPLVPNRVVYPEIYPKDPCIYNTDNQLFKKLKSFCSRPDLVRHLWTEEVARDTCEKYSTESLRAKYLSLLQS